MKKNNPMPSATVAAGGALFEKTAPLDPPQKLFTKDRKPQRLLKELCQMSGQLSEIINKTNDKEELDKLREQHIKITELIDKTGKIQFNENDKYYRDTIKKFKDTEKVFKAFAANQIEIMEMLKSITDIIANVERMIMVWELINEK
ncbi:MAG: hypothetical protein JSV88_33570 [Candidatus Aminicenantes bacterium]|nr:MAG: hypothetical protein JSV88_33570 [Candidatus Aminicenantes bacterium]